MNSTKKKTLKLLIELRGKCEYDKHLKLLFSNLSIKLASEVSICPVCREKTNILKTQSKICYSYMLGKFVLTERISYCKEHKYLKNTNNIIKYYSGLSNEIVCDNYKITFDLVVKIGLLRYCNYMQLAEIKNQLKYGYASIDLPISTIGLIGKRFLEFCKMLHQKYEYKIKENIISNGGYALHFDGTTEKQSQVIVFVVKDSISGHVLSSVKIKGESKDEIKPVIEDVAKKYGTPLLTQSDLKPGFKTCVDEIFDKKVLHIFCNYHFLRSFDNYFKEDYQVVKKHIVSCRLKSTLFSINISIGNNIDDLPKLKFDNLSDIKGYYKENHNSININHLTMSACISWILKYQKDSTGKGFPFDLPYLDLYIRLMSVKEFIEKIGINKENEYCVKFCNTVSRIQSNDISEKSINLLKFRREWFQKLRAVLYMEGEGKTKDDSSPLSERYKLNIDQLEKIPDNIESYLQNLSEQIDQCEWDDQKEILLTFQKKINKYKFNLIPPTHAYKADGKEIIVIIERTNNCLEQWFRIDKSGLRRITGREKLTREFNSVGEFLPYFNSMKNHDLFKSMFENEEILTQEFASLFAKPKKTSNEMRIIQNQTAMIIKQEVENVAVSI